MQAFRLGTEPGSSRKALIGLLLIAAYVGTDWVSLALAGIGHVPPFWPCNAFLAALVVLVADDRRLRPMLLAAVVCSLPVFLTHAPSFRFGLVRAGINAGEGCGAGTGAVCWRCGAG